MSIYGYKTSSPPLFGFTNGNADNHRATVFGLTSEPGHAWGLGVRGGYHDASDPCSVILAAYATSGSVPTSLLEYTEEIAVNNRMTSAGTSQELEGDLLESFTFASGIKLGLAFVADDGDFAHGQGSSAHTMYFRGNSSGLPPDPAGMTGQTETQIAIWLNYEANVAPDIPTNLSPADGATVTDTTPTYAADFDDANETLPNGLASDYLNAYQIQVRSVASDGATTGTLVWDSGTVGASGTERTNRRFSMDHGGAALSQGTRYQWRCREQDKLGAWSPWSHADAVAWSDFLVASGGVVTIDGTPTGRITDTTPDFQGRYHHVSASAADRVQIRLYVGSTLIATSPEITKAVVSAALPGTLFTITAAESAFGTLASGVLFGYSMRVRTTTGSVWSDWSAIRTFNTNAKPATPTSLTPTGSAASSSLPLLSLVTSDADGDTLTVPARIKNSGGTVLFTRTMTRVGSTNVYTYQTTATDLASFATYKWDGSATDGDLTSAQSSEATFVYADGPVITITSPTEAEVITTDTPTFTWTVTDQQKKRLYVYAPDIFTSIYLDAVGSPIVSTVSTYVMPANLLANNTNYQVSIWIENSAPISGWSQPRNFRLEYVPPAIVAGFLASPETANFDQVPSVIRLTWVPVTTDAADFEGYVIYNRDSGQPFSNAHVLMELSSRDQDTWVDTMPQSGVEQVYSIVQKVRESTLDILTSDPAESSTTVNLNGSVISDVRDGLQLRAVFDSVKERSEQTVQEHTDVNTWDGGAPWSFEGPTYYKTIAMEAYIYATDAGTVADILEAVRGAPFEPQPLTPPYGGLAGVRADGSSVQSCCRDERGRKIFGRMREVEVTDLRLLRADLSFLFSEIYYVEAIT